MDLTRRFYFRGNASALSGLFYRPNTVIVDMPGASSLGVSGGRSQSEIAGPLAFGDVIRFGSAKTFAEGVFDDVRAATAVSNFEAAPITLNSTTNVRAEIRDLAVGKTPQTPLFRASLIRGALVSHSPANSGEPSIAPGPGTVIQGVDIGGFELKVVLNTELFRRLDTRSKVSAAADDARLADEFRQHFVPDATINGQVRRSGLVVRNGLIYTTIVKEITWVSEQFPESNIDGHVVTIPDFGKIFFGELLVGGAERRLTMVRFEMGSPIGGWADGGGLDTNGSFYP